MYRFFISSIIAILWIGASGQKLPQKPSQWSGIFWSGTIGTSLSLVLLFYGFEKTSALAGNVLTALGPLVVTIAGALFLKERVTINERTGLLVAFFGTLIIMQYNDGLGALEGNVLVLLAIIADSAAAILTKITMRNRVSASMLSHLSFIIGLITIAPFAFMTHGGSIISTIRNAPLSAHAGVWFMAVVSGTIAYTLRNRAVQKIEVSETAPFNYLYPLWGAPLSVLWLGEKITTPFIIGSIVIALGVILAETKNRRMVRR